MNDCWELKNAHGVPRPSVAIESYRLAFAHVALTQPQNDDDEPGKSSDEESGRAAFRGKERPLTCISSSRKSILTATGEDDADDDEPTL
jgi:hypothetical protein